MVYIFKTPEVYFIRANLYINYEIKFKRITVGNYTLSIVGCAEYKGKSCEMMDYRKRKLNKILRQSNYERFLTLFFLSMILAEHYIKLCSVYVTFCSVPCTHITHNITSLIRGLFDKCVPDKCIYYDDENNDAFMK